MESATITNMCMIINKETDEVLVQNRIKGNWKGIAFPGGKTEQGEPIADSTIREVFEETGLTVSDLRLCGVMDCYGEKDKSRYLVFLFATDTYTGALIEHSEEGEVFWVKKDILLSLNLADGFENMVEVVTNPALNEYFICENNEKTDWIPFLK